MAKVPMLKVIRVRLSEREQKEVQEAASKEQRTVSDYVRLSLRKATLLTLAGRRTK